MNTADYQTALNDLLVNIGKSLLQYMGEAWPWTSESAEAEQRSIQGLVEEQKHDIQHITEFLWADHWPIDFGTYPTEYTDLHYLSLDFLLKQLLENTAANVQEVRNTLQFCEGYPQATPLLNDVLAREQHICEQVEQMVKKYASGSPQWMIP